MAIAGGSPLSVACGLWVSRAITRLYRQRAAATGELGRGCLRASALRQRCHREAVPRQLLVVELGPLLVTGPDDRATAEVDAVGEADPLVVADPREYARQREGHALEGVVVVVQHNHVPG